MLSMQNAVLEMGQVHSGPIVGYWDLIVISIWEM